ncbi:hypothetical protein PF005_g22152 [Phytophthora fragariae]|uniref:Uncharacterized protein n=1 Tax=Phytophthora fragariae TaxID=53985 RepID=A0A6A3DZ05_9STRA|nr:hypothetical protein PF003_g29283 [Phytophthora fragariae]KAE8926872.1 hypothetical protein PF009_g22947 [Phytophthora fragariae]KAE9183276.1 hypothetical protein PF005_g22152 [Phytophthora fragariae]KAE9193638.1 hypothetical protein PF004_g20958 [Phytophthora fragariae]
MPLVVMLCRCVAGCHWLRSIGGSLSARPAQVAVLCGVQIADPPRAPAATTRMSAVTSLYMTC